jgi:hypothetical protein
MIRMIWYKIITYIGKIKLRSKVIHINFVTKFKTNFFHLPQTKHNNPKWQANTSKSSPSHQVSNKSCQTLPGKSYATNLPTSSNTQPNTFRWLKEGKDQSSTRNTMWRKMIRSTSWPTTLSISFVLCRNAEDITKKATNITAKLNQGSSVAPGGSDQVIGTEKTVGGQETQNYVNNLSDKFGN